MNKFKKTKLVALTAFTLLGVSYTAFATINKDNSVISANAEDSVVEIGTANEFNAFFDGSATNSAKSAKLTADIDLSGASFTAVRMAGEYSGTFNGQGYTVSNFTLASGAAGLFNIISTNGSVSNLNLDVTSGHSGGGAIAYSNGGTISNCYVHLTINDNINTYGAICLVNSGTISECKTYIDIADSSSANTIYPITQTSGSTITDCCYNTNKSGAISSTGGTLDSTITPTIPSTKETLSAPTNVTLTDGTLTFDAVTNATSYEITYVSNTDSSTTYTVSTSDTTYSLSSSDVKYNSDTYTIKVCAVGDSSKYNKSEYTEATTTYTISITTLPIAIDATSTKINGAGVEIYLADKPSITLDDITVTILSFASTTYSSYQTTIMNSGVTKSSYDESSGRFYGTISNGFPDNSDIVMTIRISYTSGSSIYRQDLTFVGNVYKPNYGSLEQLSAPTGIAISDEGELTFTEVTNATGYKVKFVNSAGSTSLEKEITTNSWTIDTTELDSGTYKIYVKALADETNYTESDYSTTDVTFTVEKEFPTTGTDFEINATSTQIDGAGISVYITSAPDIAVGVFQVKLVSITSSDGVNKTSNFTLSKSHYVKDQNGFLYLNLSSAPITGDTVVIAISYVYNDVTYLKELTFVSGEYVYYGHCSKYGTQTSTDGTAVRVIGKIFLDNKTVNDLINDYSSIQFTITASIDGVSKNTTLTSQSVMSYIKDSFGEEVKASDGYLFCCVIIQNIPASITFEIIDVEIELVK